MTAASDRRAMIAKIHIGKKDLGLDDDTYRAILERVTGHRSARDCTDKHLTDVLAELGAKGFKASAGTGRTASKKSWVRKIWAIWGDIAPLLPDANEAALRGFVTRQTKSPKNPNGIANPEWLSPAEGNKVIAGLQGWLGRLRAKGGNNAAV